MIDLNITDEELNALKLYKDEYKAINQMLVSNSESDIALLSDEVEKEVVTIKYDRESVIEYIKTAKLLYSAILKEYYKNKRMYNTTFYRGSNLAEVEMLKVNPYIDKFMIATVDKEEAEEKFASNWNRPASMNLTLLGNVPYLQVSDLIKGKEYKNDIIISPFTKVKSVEENSEKVLDKNSKTVKIYNVQIEKQELDQLSEDERWGLYKYILDNSIFIKRKLEECINLEKENTLNFENIRKLEQLLAKYENEDEQEESDEESIEDAKNDIERITSELADLKRVSTELFEIRKENINFINVWKRNIAVYMIAECKEIENQIIEIVDANLAENQTEEDIESEKQTEEVKTEESKTKVTEDTIVLKKEEEAKDTEKVTTQDTIVVDISKPDVKDTDEEKTEEVSQNEAKETSVAEDNIEENEEVAYNTAITSCDENIEYVEKMLVEIKDLITKQQNHAKIAGNIGASYSALNNAFEMRKEAESLLDDLKDVKLKIEDLKETEDKDELADRFKIIAKNNIEINTLLNYLNNPKIAVKNSNATRFDEMAIIEENELKRAIAEKAREIRGEAELRKLKDDLEIINDKTALERIIGFFTGRNKLDEFMIEQIEIRQKAIRKTLSKKMSLAHNYSVHELMAEISMFIEDNQDDELVEEDVKDLKAMSDELKKNFVVSDFKVKSIITEKEHKNLPVEKKKMTKKDIIEIETYRFLNKYGYDISNNNEDKDDPKYSDTMSHEISRVIDYVKNSDVL